MSNPPSPPRSYLTRNWWWVVPSGCLAVLLVSVAALAAFVWVVFAGVKTSDAYRLGFDRARYDCEVIEKLGGPIREGWWISGSVNVNGATGRADFSAPLRGAERDGTLFLTATKQLGKWTFEGLEVQVENSDERIDLLRGARRRCDPRSGASRPHHKKSERGRTSFLSRARPFPWLDWAPS